MDVVSCFEMDVFGVDCAAFDCHVFFGDDGSCLSSGDPASSCFFGNDFRMVFPSGAAFNCHVFFSNQGQPFLLMALSVFRLFTLNLNKTQS